MKLKAFPALFLTATFLTATAARAHHIWIVPQGALQAKVVFSDTLAPDRAELLKKIAHTKLWVRQQTGKETALEWRKGDDAFLLNLPTSGAVGGTCVYGVETHDHRLGKEVAPYLLVYHPKVIMGDGGKPWGRLPLEITTTRANEGTRFQVLFKGKPAAGAELIMFSPGVDGREEYKTNERGELTMDLSTPGLYGLRTRYIEKAAGQHGDKKYEEVRHYASLVIRVEDGAGK